jgi:hypothetical protein
MAQHSRKRKKLEGLSSTVHLTLLLLPLNGPIKHLPLILKLPTIYFLHGHWLIQSFSLWLFISVSMTNSLSQKYSGCVSKITSVCFLVWPCVWTFSYQLKNQELHLARFSAGHWDEHKVRFKTDQIQSHRGISHFKEIFLIKTSSSQVTQVDIRWSTRKMKCPLKVRILFFFF